MTSLRSAINEKHHDPAMGPEIGMDEYYAVVGLVHLFDFLDSDGDGQLSSRDISTSMQVLDSQDASSAYEQFRNEHRLPYDPYGLAPGSFVFHSQLCSANIDLIRNNRFTLSDFLRYMYKCDSSYLHANYIQDENHLMEVAFLEVINIAQRVVRGGRRFPENPFTEY